MTAESTSSYCAGADRMAALLAGNLPSEQVGAALRHAAACPICGELLKRAGYRAEGAGASSSNDRSPNVPAAKAHAPTERPSAATVEMNPPRGSSDVPAGGDIASDPTLTAGRAPAYPFLDPPLEPGELGRLDNYRILRVLGEGGMGLVFEANDSVLNRRVAIKVLRPGEFDESANRRFLQEARLAASLPHERIVTIFQVGQARQSPYIVMELLAGESLEARLRRETWLPLAEALRMAREVAEGLAVAHERGLVHRDIKPPNVFLEAARGADPGGRVKLLDFGVARPVESREQLTLQGHIVGTPGYMSPEQICGMSLDARTDLFSLGCLLYAMLAGESPFRRASDMATLQAAVTENLPPIREKLPHLPAPVAELIERLLQKNPADRPPSAEAVVEEIRMIERRSNASGSATTAFGNKTRRSFRSRHKPLSWGALSGAVTIVAAAIVGLWVALPTPTAAPAPTADKVADSDPLGGPLRGASGSSAALPPSALLADAPPTNAPPPIKIGVLLSLTGVMGASERPLLDAIEFAVKEINDAGGLLEGRQVVVVTEDCQSKEAEFPVHAEKLIEKDGAVTLFGCWRSPARKAVEAVCAKHDHLLVFPLTYEGLEESPYVIYMGGAPNQQLLPAAQFAFTKLKKKKFFLVGAEGIYSRAAHAIMADEILHLGGQVVGDELVALGSPHFREVVEKIKAAGADAILNTVSGTTGNHVFFHCLADAGLAPPQTPTISFRVSEGDLGQLADDHIVGQYAAWSYFESLPIAENRLFLEPFFASYRGQGHTVNDPMEACYAGVKLWARAVAAANSDDTAAIRRAFVDQKMPAPEGDLTIDAKNRHAWRTSRIGQVVELAGTKKLGFKIVDVSPEPLEPQPFPSSRAKAQWLEFLEAASRRETGAEDSPAASPR